LLGAQLFAPLVVALGHGVVHGEILSRKAWPSVAFHTQH
jgi:hypothetical protein